MRSIRKCTSYFVRRSSAPPTRPASARCCSLGLGAGFAPGRISPSATSAPAPRRSIFPFRSARTTTRSCGGGAGANVALACDLVLAARSASFVQSFARLGLVPDSGGTYFLPRLAGTARAMGLALLGEKLSAEDAERWGLIWKAVDDDRLLAEANALARALAAGPTKGYGLVKRAIYASAGNSREAQLDLERDLQRDAGSSADYREGVSAFLEKREPRYQGK